MIRAWHLFLLVSLPSAIAPHPKSRFLLRSIKAELQGKPDVREFLVGPSFGHLVRIAGGVETGEGESLEGMTEGRG
jgi:hypothetical protein